MEEPNYNQEQPKSENAPHPYQPIVCPICGSVSLAFVTNAHKAIAAKIGALVSLFFFVYFSFIAITNSNQNEDFGKAVIAFVVYAVFQIYIFITESTTHVQAICRDCGHIWLLN